MKYYFLLVFGLFGCGSEATNVNDAAKTPQRIMQSEPMVGNDAEDGVLNGMHCANVFFNNPKTGKSGTYTLEVSVEKGYVVDIHFTDGHLDTSHFEAPMLDDKQQCALTTDRGYHYRIEILDSNEKCLKQEAQEVQCSGITKSGAQCKRHTSHPSGRCHQHR